MEKKTWVKGDRLKIFPDTDVEAYIRYFDSIGLKTIVKDDCIIIGGVVDRKLDKVAGRIKDIRIKMYFSVDELAEEIGTTTKVIEAWESGRKRPQGKALNNFLELSGATKEYVLEGKGEWVDDIKQLMKELHE